MAEGKRLKVLYLTDLLKSHVTVSALTFSHRFRVKQSSYKKFQLYLIMTSDFKMLFINEMYHLVAQLDMSSIRLVSYVEFYDAESKLITAGIDGIFLFDFVYKGKYDPHHAA